MNDKGPFYITKCLIIAQSGALFLPNHGVKMLNIVNQRGRRMSSMRISDSWNPAARLDVDFWFRIWGAVCWNKGWAEMIIDTRAAGQKQPRRQARHQDWLSPSASSTLIWSVIKLDCIFERTVILVSIGVFASIAHWSAMLSSCLAMS